MNQESIKAYVFDDHGIFFDESGVPFKKRTGRTVVFVCGTIYSVFSMSDSDAWYRGVQSDDKLIAHFMAEAERSFDDAAAKDKLYAEKKERQKEKRKEYMAKRGKA